MTFPGVALLLTVLAFNLIGDGLQDALNPRTRALRGVRRERAVHSVPQQGGAPYEEVRSLDPVRELSPALALIVAACGGSNNSSSGSGGSEQPRQRQDQAGKQGGNADVPRRRRRRLPRPRPDVLHVRLQVAVRDQPPAVLVQARRRRQAGAGPRRGRAADLRGQQDDHGQDQEGRQVRARRSTARSRPKDIKYAFERAFSKNVPAGYAGTYFSSTSRARPTKPTTGDQADLRHQDARRPHDRLQAQDGRARRCVAAALVMPITMPVPEEYAKKFDAKTPVDVRPVRRLHRPVHGQERPARASSIGRDAGQAIDIVRNPNWDKTTDYRPAYLDEITIEEGNDDLTRRLAPQRSAAARRMCCDSGQPPAPVLKQARSRRTRTRSAVRPVAAARAGSRSTRRSSRSTTSTSARRSSRLRPQRAAPDARRRGRSARSPRAGSRPASRASRSPAA